MKRQPTRTTKIENDLMRLAYGELTGLERQNLENALQTNPSLASFYQEVLAMQDSLDRATRKPPKNFLKRIMDYSKHHESDSLQSV